MKKICNIIPAFVCFLMIMCLPPAECEGSSDLLDDLPKTLFGNIDVVTKTGVLPELSMPQNAIQEGKKASDMLNKVIRALVKQDDDFTSSVEKIVKILQEEIAKSSNTISAKLAKTHWDDVMHIFLPTLRVNTKGLTDTAMKLYKYNLTVDEIRRYRYLCDSAPQSPSNILDRIYFTLIEPCQRSFSTKGKLHYVLLLEQFTDSRIPITKQAELALFAANNDDIPVYKIIDEFNEQFSKLMKSEMSSKRRIDTALEEMKKIGKHSLCSFDNIFYGNLCDKYALLNFMVGIANLAPNIYTGAISCGGVLYNDLAERNEFLERIYSRLNEMMNFMSNYYNKAMDSSFSMCEKKLMKDTLDQMKPQYIYPVQYQNLANNLMKRLNEAGKENLLRSCVIAQYNKNSGSDKILITGPPDRINEVYDLGRYVFIVCTYHNPDESRSVEQEKFLNTSRAMIDETFDNVYNNDDLNSINKALVARNISLTDENRHEVAIWIREFALVGSCPISDHITSANPVKEGYHLLSYYYPNSLNPFLNCEAIHVYILM